MSSARAYWACNLLFRVYGRRFWVSCGFMGFRGWDVAGISILDARGSLRMSIRMSALSSLTSWALGRLASEWCRRGESLQIPTKSPSCEIRSRTPRIKATRDTTVPASCKSFCPVTPTVKRKNLNSSGPF